MEDILCSEAISNHKLLKYTMTYFTATQVANKINKMEKRKERESRKEKRIRDPKED